VGPEWTRRSRAHGISPLGASAEAPGPPSSGSARQEHRVQVFGATAAVKGAKGLPVPGAVAAAPGPATQTLQVTGAARRLPGHVAARDAVVQRSGIEGRSALRTSPSDCTDGPPPFAVLEADADAVVTATLPNTSQSTSVHMPLHMYSAAFPLRCRCHVGLGGAGRQPLEFLRAAALDLRPRMCLYVSACFSRNPATVLFNSVPVCAYLVRFGNSMATAQC